jgi:3-mercaptopyruvate sulfurtransferase SseA
LQTFFSTTFFDFNANFDGRVYSPWLWLYFLVTAILTLLVVVGTWLLWKKEKAVVEKPTPPDPEPKGGNEYATNQVVDVETVQYIEHQIGHAAAGAAFARLGAISDWAKSNRQRVPLDGKKAKTLTNTV